MFGIKCEGKRDRRRGRGRDGRARGRKGTTWYIPQPAQAPGAETPFCALRDGSCVALKTKRRLVLLPSRERCHLVLYLIPRSLSITTGARSLLLLRMPRIDTRLKRLVLALFPLHRALEGINFLSFHLLHRILSDLR